MRTTVKTLLPPTTAETEVRDVVSPDLWLRIAGKVAQRHGLSGTPEPYASGSDLVCRIGEAVLKLSTPAWAEQIESEATLQAHLAGRVPFKVPEPLARGEFEEWPYLIMSHVPGLSLKQVWGTLDARERVNLAARLGEATAALHRVEPATLPGPAWGEFRRGLRASLAERHARCGVDPAWLAQLEPFVRSVEPFPACGLVQLHTELLGEHVLLYETARGWDVAGLIDLADGRAGHAEYDVPAVVEFVFKGQPGCLRAFLQGYGYPAEALGAHTQRRLLVWGLIHRYGSLQRMLTAVDDSRVTTLGGVAERLYAL